MPKKEAIKGGVLFLYTEMEVADKLEAYRLSVGATKGGFAKEFLGVDPSNYTHILNGGQYPGYKSLSRLNSKGFDVRKILSVDMETVKKSESK